MGHVRRRPGSGSEIRLGEKHAFHFFCFLGRALPLVCNEKSRLLMADFLEQYKGVAVGGHFGVWHKAT